MLKREYQTIKKTNARKHLNLIASLSQFVSRFQICTAKTLLPSSIHNLTDWWRHVKEKKGMTIKMSKTQLAYNMKIGGFFISVSRIHSIPNTNCFTRIRNWILIRTGEHRSTKTNWKWVVSQEGKWYVCRIETDGEGLYLGPTTGKGFQTVGRVFTWWKKVSCMTVQD